jgi:hypothetical protein
MTIAVSVYYAWLFILNKLCCYLCPVRISCFLLFFSHIISCFLRSLLSRIHLIFFLLVVLGFELSHELALLGRCSLCLYMSHTSSPKIPEGISMTCHCPVWNLWMASSQLQKTLLSPLADHTFPPEQITVAFLVWLTMCLIKHLIQYCIHSDPMPLSANADHSHAKTIST